jgi:hypothetical protein
MVQLGLEFPIANCFGFSIFVSFAFLHFFFRIIIFIVIVVENIQELENRMRVKGDE